MYADGLLKAGFVNYCQNIHVVLTPHKQKRGFKGLGVGELNTPPDQCLNFGNCVLNVVEQW